MPHSAASNSDSRRASAISFEADDAPKVLARNSACHQCRKRKLKCDAIKPVCANCQKPRQRGSGKGESPAELESCTWDEPKEPSARTRRRRESAKRQALSSAQDRQLEDEQVTAKKAKLNELEGRIGESNTPNGLADVPSAACHSVLEGQKQELSHQSIYDPLLTDPSFTNHLEQPQISVPPLNSWSNIPPLYNGSSELSSPSKPVFGAEFKVEQPSYSDLTSDPLAGLFDLIWPDWPKDLPKYEVVEQMIRVFFEKVPTLPKMLSKNQLLQNLMLPPSNRNFPVRPLLHAILAIASNYISETTLATKAYFPTGASSTDYIHPTADFDNSSSTVHFNFTSQSSSQRSESATALSLFQMWHRRKAFETFARCIDKGDQLLRCLQAYIIVTTLDQYNAWWTDLWMETGACLRMATPMRINESPNVPESSLRRGTHSLLGPPASDMEQAERDRTWWMAYLLERSATSATTWAPAMSEDEITVELPVLQSTYDSGIGQLQGVQTLASPDLYTSHPPCHRDSLCLYIKSLKLYTEVGSFFRRYSQGSHSIAAYLSHPTFRLLLSQINSFRMSFPPEFRRPTHFKVGQGVEALDRDLIQALWILHAASIALGEPLITKDTWTHDGARMTLAAIRAALSLLYDITATSYDLTLFSPHCSFCWCMASRGLIHFVDAATRSGDLVSAAVFRSEVEVFRLALQRYGERFPVPVKHLKMVDDLLAQMEDPSSSTKSMSILYDCTVDDIIASNRAVGAVISTLSTPSSQAMFTPSGSSGYTPDEPQNLFHSTLPSKSAENLVQMPLYSNTNTNNVNALGGSDSAPPKMMDVNWQDSWDINSFSFDLDAVVSVFESNGAVFDGSQFNLPSMH
ncbi:uncharacterized protein I206_100412 [Kwoniella pini CBS 10737]|uniref:Zn(2)-C6 fungal-type domain-containing protein n=1 Tax=Kwoniella pini CBS 10737 TaxID=1296096 RepID=A0A1B9IDN4_9TREE|nr:uncharacterized protein I206_00913 [Kwoniella pini CBS 10737]OCF53607.1 hypothetical protein I206_00913 [Kwoniella pini CBS 10737]